MGEISDIRVWAIPDEVRKFKDDLICAVKDNPNPVVLPVIC